MTKEQIQMKFDKAQASVKRDHEKILREAANYVDSGQFEKEMDEDDRPGFFEKLLSKVGLVIIIIGLILI